jgi:hypothetical protein
MDSTDTTRTPYTKPLTSFEMREIQRRISEVVRARTNPPAGKRIGSFVPLSTHEERVKEVEDAIAFAARGKLRRDAWPPVCHVRPAALSALVTP